MKKKGWIGAGIAIAVALLIIQTLTGVQQVEVLKAETGDITTWVEDTAYVQSRDEVTIQASQSGKIVRIAVETGEQVSAGQELLVMDNPDLQYQLNATAVQTEQLQGQLSASVITVEQARLDLAEDQKNLGRARQLFESGAISQADYDASVQRNITLQKAVESQQQIQQSLRRQLEKQNTLYQELKGTSQQLVVKSTAAGMVLDLPIKEQQTVMAGASLVQIGNINDLELKTELLSDDVGAVKVGQKATISAPLLGDKVLEGKVTKIYPRAYEKVSALGVIQRRVPVLISLSPSQLLEPGYEVQVRIETSLQQNVVTLPRTAIRVNEQGQNEVLAIIDGKIKHSKVEIGIRNPEKAEVVSGLKAGQRVVRDASMDVKENTRVKI
ncbi:MAG TPA: efflux RND transporter periplasmic adaptor subunit [Syntrophomonas sp.]|nr:efflux RND transporter periplasmic adaptor subunit [Syntrophomonas sp.]HRW12811.1 efflux RND transporter periplasmic adaptor subunit [Syntrophomonas sp.]